MAIAVLPIATVLVPPELAPFPIATEFEPFEVQLDPIATGEELPAAIQVLPIATEPPP